MDQALNMASVQGSVYSRVAFWIHRFVGFHLWSWILFCMVCCCFDSCLFVLVVLFLLSFLAPLIWLGLMQFIPHFYFDLTQKAFFLCWLRPSILDLQYIFLPSITWVVGWLTACHCDIKPCMIHRSLDRFLMESPLCGGSSLDQLNNSWTHGLLPWKPPNLPHPSTKEALQPDLVIFGSVLSATKGIPDVSAKILTRMRLGRVEVNSVVGNAAINSCLVDPEGERQWETGVALESHGDTWRQMETDGDTWRHVETHEDRYTCDISAISSIEKL